MWAYSPPPQIAHLYQKIQILAILGAVSPYFKSDNGYFFW